MAKKRLGIIIFSILFLLGITFLVRGQNESGIHINSLDPFSGPVGTEVSIKGAGFNSEQGIGKVFFYNEKSASIISWSNETIVCKVPTGAKTGQVIIIDKKGNKSNGVKFKIVLGVLIAPTDLVAENITTSSVTLKWDAVKNSSGYTISLGTDEKATNLNSTDVKDNSYDKTELEQNKTYYWKVKAVSSLAKKNSGWSRIVSFKTKAEEVKPAPVQPKKNNISLTTIIIIAALVIILILAIIVLIKVLSRRRRLDLGENNLKPEPEEGPLPNISEGKEVSDNSRPDMADISKPQDFSSNEPYPPSSASPGIPPSEPKPPESEPPSSKEQPSSNPPMGPGTDVGL